MAPPYKTDADFEHRVFVKDVPADLATTIIGFLSQHYNPVKVENLFPRGATTTLAVSFLTFEEASQVQLETDAARMENSILRAEMDRHPRRPMRVPRSRMHATRRANDNIHEEEVKDIKKRPAEPGYVSPLGKAQPDTSAASTWAQVVSKDNKIDFAASNFASTDDIGPFPFNTSTVKTVRSEGDVIDDQNIKKMKPSAAKAEPHIFESIFPPWHTSNSTENIRRRHQHDCVFCMKRLAHITTN